ncbi:hypothetical protein Glove_192g42 [Diversispora epigaea]|uniref:Uncharacterized protein n=1 Tax=Diversispora epigaea TaxID=1348612 RepID=A0A397ILJ2_9GLOM|nr:hypothetical protein Glove_192g42 [Diversispora epigaea]
MSTFFEVLAYISSQKGTFTSGVVSGIALYKTLNNKTVEFTYRLFIESKQPECEEFFMGDMVFLSGKFCFDALTGDTAGIVLTVSKAIKYPNRNLGSWTIINYPKTRPSVSFSAVCESTIKNGVSQVNFSIGNNYEGNEMKYVNMRTTLFGCLSRITEVSHYFVVAYAHKLSRWINLKFQVNRRYMISGILDGFLKEENPSLVRLDKKSNENENLQNRSQLIAHTPYQNLLSQSPQSQTPQPQTPQPSTSLLPDNTLSNQLSQETICNSINQVTPEPKAKPGRKKKTTITTNPEVEKKKPVRKSPRKKNIGDLATLILENNVDNNIIDHSLIRQMSDVVEEVELSE